jgi:hypothetical protein
MPAILNNVFRLVQVRAENICTAFAKYTRSHYLKRLWGGVMRKHTFPVFSSIWYMLWVKHHVPLFFSTSVVTEVGVCCLHVHNRLWSVYGKTFEDSDNMNSSFQFFYGQTIRFVGGWDFRHGENIFFMGHHFPTENFTLWHTTCINSPEPKYVTRAWHFYRWVTITKLNVVEVADKHWSSWSSMTHIQMKQLSPLSRPWHAYKWNSLVLLAVHDTHTN